MQISSCGKRKRCVIVHANSFKVWNEEALSIHRIAIAEEQEGEFESSKIILSDTDLSEEQDKRLQQVLSDHAIAFDDIPGCTSIATHSIVTSCDKHIHSHPYRLYLAWKDQIREEITTLPSQGIIKESRSDWCSPIVPVKKPNGSLRLYVDFHRLNSVTKPDPFCMLLIDDILDQLGEAEYLSKVNLSKGFYQIPIAEIDREKMAFVTPMGTFEFNRMPFGLMNVPATFQRAIKKVL